MFKLITLPKVAMFAARGGLADRAGRTGWGADAVIAEQGRRLRRSMPCWLTVLAVAAVTAGSAAAAGVQPKVAYGPDNRVEVFTLTGQRAANANATVALVPAGSIFNNGNGTSRLVSPSLGAAYNVCAGQRYRAQPTAATCSGFLARPNRVVTAGHCVSRAGLGQTRFVFGYRMLNQTQARTTVSNGSIYRGVQLVVDRLEGKQDFAVVRLDRNVSGRSPAPIQSWNAVARNTPLYVIGHPSGLPAKLAGNAKTFNTASPSFFSANLDTFGGNSGSPVFNANSNNVIGILVRGAPDYRPKGNCDVVNVLANTRADEEATRISLVRPYLGPTSPASAARLAAALER